MVKVKAKRLNLKSLNKTIMSCLLFQLRHQRKMLNLFLEKLQNLLSQIQNQNLNLK
ncbi:hypothetical protein D3C86_1954880 [compost metagenome]